MDFAKTFFFCAHSLVQERRPPSLAFWEEEGATFAAFEGHGWEHFSESRIINYQDFFLLLHKLDYIELTAKKKFWLFWRGFYNFSCLYFAGGAKSGLRGLTLVKMFLLLLAKEPVLLLYCF